MLHFACNPAVGTQPRAHLPVLRLLLNHGAGQFIDVQNNVGDTPLIVCARQGDSDGLQLLLEAGADPSVKNRFGDTALHVAARLGHAKLIASLLEWKAVDPGAINCLGKTAGQIANARVRDVIVSAGSAGGKRVRAVNKSAYDHQSADTESAEAADTGATKRVGSTGGQIASRRACDVVSTASTMSVGHTSGNALEAPSPAPPPAFLQAWASQAPSSAQTLPIWPVASPRSASPKAGSKKRKKSRGNKSRVAKEVRRWTPEEVRKMHRHPFRLKHRMASSHWPVFAQDRELREAVAQDGLGNWVAKAARFSAPRGPASLRLRWKDIETKAAKSTAAASGAAIVSPTSSSIVHSPVGYQAGAASTTMGLSAMPGGQSLQLAAQQGMAGGVAQARATAAAGAPVHAGQYSPNATFRNNLT